MNFIFMLHSHFRWLVALVLVVVLFKFLFGWLRHRNYGKLDSILFRISTAVIDLQLAFGLIYLIWSGLEGMGFPRFRLEHGFIMIIAAVLPHLYRRWKNAEDAIRYRNGFYIILITAVLIFAGVLMLPGGMIRWTGGN